MATSPRRHRGCLRKDEAQRDRLAEVLATNIRGIGTAAVLLAPIMPESAQKLWQGIGGEGDIADQRIQDASSWVGSDRVGELPPLFPRIEQS